MMFREIISTARKNRILCMNRNFFSSKCPFLGKADNSQLLKSRVSFGNSGIEHATNSGIPSVLCPHIRNIKQPMQLKSESKQLLCNRWSSASAADITAHPLYPKRDGMDGNETEWRMDGVPTDYSEMNKYYLQQRIGSWTDPNSLENVVSNLVKTLEMELTNKMNSSQWVSMVPEVFKYRANDGVWVNTEQAVEKGSYNILMQNADEKLYDASASFEQSHQQFFNAFTKGFMWELLKIYSAPPNKVAFTWRHWGVFDGVFNDNKGKDQEINVYGFGTANVRLPNEECARIRVEQFEVWYDMNRFLTELNGVEFNGVQDAGFYN